MSELRNLFWERSNVTDKYGQKSVFGDGHSYGLGYEWLLEKYKNIKSNILEIGTNIGGGSSCFCDYLPLCSFYSVDIEKK